MPVTQVTFVTYVICFVSRQSRAYKNYIGLMPNCESSIDVSKIGRPITPE